MYQILVEYINGKELTLQEKQELDYWVYVEEHRNKLYNQLTDIIQLQNELKAVVRVNDLYALAMKVKTSLPVGYIDLTGKKDFLSLQAAISEGLKKYSNDLVLQMVREYELGALLIAFVVLLIVCLFIYLMIWFSY